MTQNSQITQMLYKLIKQANNAKHTKKLKLGFFVIKYVNDTKHANYAKIK